MKNIYIVPVLTVIELSNEDIVATSLGMGSQEDDLGSIVIFN